mgnify:CR=1 FL=1
MSAVLLAMYRAIKESLLHSKHSQGAGNSNLHVYLSMCGGAVAVSCDFKRMSEQSAGP